MEPACEIIVTLYMLFVFSRSLISVGQEEKNKELMGLFVVILVSILMLCLYCGGLYD